jgi:histone deacetylase 6
LVLVSAGFDAALGDPLGGYKVTPIGYAQMTKMLSSLANGRVIMALEVRIYLLYSNQNFHIFLS